MNKLFDVIPIEDYAVVVDRGAKIVEGWKGWAYKQDVKGQLFKHFYTTNTWYDDALIVIATLYKRIDNIPLIELHENNNQELEIAMWKLANYIPNTCAGQEIIIGMQPDGRFYTNTTPRKGMYSEEDMRNILKKAFKDIEMKNAWPLLFPEKAVDDIYNDYIKRNKRIPKQVELEMECTMIDLSRTEDVVLPYRVLTVKITHPDTNTINPVNVIYE